ncbi:MAG: flagellin lysine-N-methylase, partial [Sporomusa sp.]
QSPADRVAEHFAVYVYPAQQPVNTPLYYYFEIETHLIDLLQCRAMAFNDRLAFLAATTQAVAALPQDQTFSCRLTDLFSKNYDWLDEVAVACIPSAFSDGDGLVENFFVNFVFKKPFYLYGFDKTLQLLNYLYRQVVNANDVADAIRQFEFQYGHEPQALLRNT